MATEHTSGPWGRNIKPARKYSTIYAGRNTHVAHLETNGLADAEIEANANLIAAAPELLEACEAALAPSNRVHLGFNALDLLEAAIAKAIEEVT